MHAITFMLKRAHLQNVQVGKKIVEAVDGMTPARFDLMYLLRRVALLEGPNLHPFAVSKLQTHLWKDLGLHRSTVCKMLKRLAELGWIERRRSEVDRRTFDVALTKAGRRRIWRAMRRVFRPRTMRGAYERLLGPKPPEPWDEFLALYDPTSQPPPPTWKTTHDGAPMHTVDVVHGVYQTIRRIAQFFGDRSAVWYDLGRRLPAGRLAW